MTVDEALELAKKLVVRNADGNTILYVRRVAKLPGRRVDQKAQNALDVEVLEALGTLADAFTELDAKQASPARAKLEALREHHQSECDEPNECMTCGILDCPDNELLHHHHDGCPACDQP